MSRPRSRHGAHFALLVAAAIASLFLTACDDDPEVVDLDPVTCGAGTELVGTVCEPVDPGDPPVTCGDGTVDDGSGQCVPNGEGGVVCGDGTTQNTDGECVPDEMIACGNGTMDDGSGQCVRICPEGTTDDGMGGCMLDGTSTCPAGTIDDGAGGCAPDLGAICAMGTVPSNDGARCITPAEAIRESVDAATVVQSSEETDATAMDDPLLVDILQGQVTDLQGLPLLGVTAVNRSDVGTANALTLPAVGNTLVLEGTIDLLGDVTGDQLADQDWDVWAFQGTAGQVVEVAAVSDVVPELTVELLSFASVSSDADFDAFTVLDDVYADSAHYRAGPTGQFAPPQRQFLLPHDGLYFLRLTDGRFEPPALGEGGSFGTVTVLADPGAPTGAPDASWFATVSLVADYGAPDTPTLDITAGSTTWSGTAAEYGQVDAESVRLSRADAQPGFVRIRVLEYDEVVVGILSLFPPDFGSRIVQFLLEPGADLTLPVPAGGLVASHDYSTLVGTPTSGYEITIVDEPVLQPFQPSSYTLVDGGTRQHPVLAEGGTILRATLDSPGSGLTPALAFFEYNADLTQRLVGCAVHEGVLGEGTVCNEIPAGEPLTVARYIERPQGELVPLVVMALDVTTGEGTGGDYTVGVETIVPQRVTVDDATASDSTGFTLAPPADARWVVFEGDLTAESLVSLSASTTSGAVALEFYTQPTDSVLTPDVSSTPAAQVAWPLLVSGFERHFVRVSSSGATVSSTVSVDAVVLDPPVVSIDDAMQTAQLTLPAQATAEGTSWLVFDGTLSAPALVELTATTSDGVVALDLFESVDGVLTEVGTAAPALSSSVDLAVSGNVVRYVRLTTTGASAVPTVTFDAAVTAQASAYTQVETPPLVIPNGGYPGDIAVSTQTVTAGAGCTIVDITVSVDITHTWAGDTELSLISPAGTAIKLEDGAGLGSGDFGVHTYPGTRTPVESLSTLVGEAVDGTWTLEAGDSVSLDEGTLNAWSIFVFESCP